MSRRYAVLTTVVVLVVAVWSAGWFVARGWVLGQLDQALVQLAGEGVAVQCPGRSATGWPFRLQISCEKPTVSLADGTRLTAEALAATGHIMDLKLVLLAFKSPLVVTAADGSAANADFSALRASLRFGGERLERMSVVADDLALAAGPAGLTLGRFGARHAEAHLRPIEGGGVDDIEIAATLATATGTIGDAEMLPAPADVGVAATVTHTALLAGGGDPALWAAAGGKVTVSEAAVELGESRIAADGTASVAGDRTVTGEFRLTGSGLDWLSRQAAEGKPMPPALGALASAFLLLGKPVEGEGKPRRLDLVLKDGKATANGLPLGDAPRLR